MSLDRWEVKPVESELKMTYQEFKKLAKDNYTKGGMVFYECWEEYQFNDYVKMFGDITEQEAMKMFECECYSAIDWIKSYRKRV